MGIIEDLRDKLMMLENTMYDMNLKLDNLMLDLKDIQNPDLSYMKVYLDEIERKLS